MMDLRLILLGLGSVLLVGCQPSRSQQAQLPPSPQLAKVQTPVLHPMPVPPRRRVAASRYQPMASTLPARTVTLNAISRTQPQVIELTPIDMPRMREVPSPDAESTTKVSSEWIRPVQPIEVAESLPVVTTNASTVESTTPQAQPEPEPQIKAVPQSDAPIASQIADTTTDNYTLELLDVDSPAVLSDDDTVTHAAADQDLTQMPQATEHADENNTFAPTAAPVPLERLADIRKDDDFPTTADQMVALPLLKEDRNVTVEPVGQIFTGSDNEPQSKPEKITVKQLQTPQPLSTDDAVPAVASARLIAVSHQPVTQPTPQPLAQTVTVAVAPQPQPEPVLPPKPKPKPDLYRVQKGDTLWSIAMRFYGDGHRWLDIARTNHIHQPNRMVEGQALRLP